MAVLDYDCEKPMDYFLELMAHFTGQLSLTESSFEFFSQM